MANPIPRRQAALPSFDDLKAMWEASGLRQKLLFSLLAIVIYRFAVLVHVWGVDSTKIAALVERSPQIFNFIDMFSGGALANVSVIALGIGPYITASIVMQLLTVVVPRLEELQKEEGEAGRRKISQYTRYATVVLALFQSFLIIKLIVMSGAVAQGINLYWFYPQAVLTLTAGAIFALWLAEMITERGIGNGGSLLILVGILSRIPIYAGHTYDLVSGNQEKSFLLILLLAIYLAVIVLVVILQEATRKITIVSAKRQVSATKVYGGQSTHIPFKINPAGVMPIIFAFAVMNFPMMIFSQIVKNAQPGPLYDIALQWERWMSGGSPLYILVEFTMIVFFTFFYASIMPSMQPKEIADNLKKHGSAIPGIKPGRPTAEKLEEILTRIILIGAIALGVITLMASSATQVTNITTLSLGTTSLIIMVGVALDTMNQIRVHLLARTYEGFLK